MWNFSFFKKKQEISGTEIQQDIQAQEQLIAHVFQFINRHDLIPEQVAAWQMAKKIKDPERQRTAYAQLYFQLERFIISHQSPVVKKDFSSKQALRTTLRAYLNPENLPFPFRIVFYQEAWQAANLFNGGL